MLYSYVPTKIYLSPVKIFPVWYTFKIYVAYCNCYCRLQLVFQWLVTAFAGQLECQELLLLWDRVVGFDSLDILVGRPLVCL